MAAVTAPSRGPGRAALALLGVGVAVEIAFLLVVPRYVTVDGATHLGGAALLRDVVQGAGAQHLRYVDLVPFPVPNVLPEIGMAVAMLVLDPAAAEKLLQLAYVVALPLALLYAVRSIRPGRDWMALLALPMTFTFAFQFGFYDFSFGVALFLVAAGYAWRHRERPGRRTAAIFGLLALVLYLTHLVPYVELGVFVGVVGAARVIEAARVGGARAAVREAGAMLPFLLGALPSLVLAVVFFLSTRSAIPADFLQPLLQVLGTLSLALGLATADRLEILVAAGLAATLGGLLLAAIVTRFRAGAFAPRAEDAMLAYAATALVVACLAPASVASGGSYIPERLALFPVYGLALWLAAGDIDRRIARLAGVAWLAAAVALVVVRLPTTLGLSAAAVEYESVAPCLAVRSTMIQVNLAHLPAGSLARTDPFGSETGRIAAATQGHDLGNFEESFPFFVFRNRAADDPYRWLLTRPDGFYGVPPGVDLAGYAARPDGTVDYVLVVGRQLATSQTLASGGWTSLSRDLAAGYRKVAVSSGGLVEAWERLAPSLAHAGDARRAASDAAACVRSPFEP